MSKQYYQHYPPGTQEIYNSFSSRNLMMKNSNELESSEGRGGGKGEPVVPPKYYPPGTQEIYNSFSSRNLMMKNGNKLESFKGRGGGKGSGIREADSDDREFPLFPDLVICVMPQILYQRFSLGIVLCEINTVS